MSGQSWRKRAMAAGRNVRATPATDATRISSRAAPLSAAISCSTDSDSSMVRRACVSSSRPASLSTMPRAARSNSGAPACSSSLAICRLMADTATCRRSDAPLRLPAWATSTKYLNAIPCMFPAGGLSVRANLAFLQSYR